MTDTTAPGTAAPAAATNTGQPERKPFLREHDGPVESPIPRGKSDRENISDFFDLLGGDPATPNTKPRKAAKPPARTHEEVEDRAFESSNRAEDHPERDDDGGESEVDDEPVRQRDDDAPPVDDEPDPDAEIQGEDDDEDEQLLQRRVKVKVDGKDLVIPIAELKNGYQRHADYSRKTAEVATQRQTLETHTSEVLSQRQALDGLLVEMATRVAQSMPQRPTPEQWDRLSRENPLEFTRLDAAWRRHDQQQTEIAQFRHANALRAREQHESQVRAGLDREAQRLFEKHPEWKDPSKGSAVKQELYKYAQTYGYDPKTLEITDSRHLDILWKAMRYDAALARASERQAGARVTRQPANVPRAAAPTPPPPRSAPPGADGESRQRPKPSKLAQAKARQAKNPNDRNAIAAFDAFLEKAG